MRDETIDSRFYLPLGETHPSLAKYCNGQKYGIDSRAHRLQWLTKSRPTSSVRPPVTSKPQANSHYILSHDQHIHMSRWRQSSYPRTYPIIVFLLHPTAARHAVRVNPLARSAQTSKGKHARTHTRGVEGDMDPR